MSEDCLFCKIVRGEIPSGMVYEDERVYAFRDIDPQAPVHVLVVPREHIGRVSEVGEGKEELVGHLVWVAAEVARREGVEEDGYRLVINCGEHGGQAVEHLHVHLLGGRAMGWPPG
ncbi:MAG: histidine triad nucleotide-binding protein [Armatimonadia bacterium]